MLQFMPEAWALMNTFGAKYVLNPNLPLLLVLSVPTNSQLSLALSSLPALHSHALKVHPDFLSVTCDILSVLMAL
jgi:hypothetical protein